MEYRKGSNVMNDGKREVTLSNNKIESRELFLEMRELTIVHNNEEYKLRITGNSKLILTK
jgi:hemin uptake protein HemP